ncbi:hypothetical protein LMG19083_04763 [Ralstonia psammae]|uniref:Uncharacterized protein n=1 Tax=Ralstonia psammae TaxID=3058598 RepID=A0ABM9JYQ4_9RALS|nr:hypothetical protein [Ralstonia sp. LMG 19083]CAJ0808738.1 hypothetical protein LMG19083_04763 [Ralstonia sp. LMG 19083]
MSENPFTQVINEILQGLVVQLNGEIGPAIKEAGFDPYQNVASGSKGIGVGTAHYSVNDLTGVSSVRFQDMVASNLTPSGNNLIGQLNFHAVLTDSLSATVSGDLHVAFLDPGISGNLRIDGGILSGSANVQVSLTNDKLCISSISDLNTQFSYAGANIWINNLGVLNYLLSPLENLVLDVAKGAIERLISSQINSVVGDQLTTLLPFCASTT